MTLISFFRNASLIRLGVGTVHSISIPPTPRPAWPLRSHAFLLSHLIQFIIVGPPPGTLSCQGRQKPCQIWILFCSLGFVLPSPGDTATPPPPPPPPPPPQPHLPSTHTHTPSSTSTHSGKGARKKINTWGCSLCHLFHGWRRRKDGTEHSHGGGQILFRVMLIECNEKKDAGVKGGVEI